MRKKVDIDMDAFAGDAASGISLTKLAEKYGIAISTASRMRSNLRDVEPSENEDSKQSEDEAVGRVRVEDAMPTAQLDTFLGSMQDDEIRSALKQLADQDKANIVQIALQMRLNDAVATA